MGGKRKNKPKAKREGTTGRRGAAAMTAVAGVKDRETNKVRAKVVEGTDTKTLQDSVRETVAPCATLCTDEAAAYRSMPEYVHEAFNHGGRPSGDRSVGRRMITALVLPLKIQGIKTKAVPFIRDSFAWNGSGCWIEPFVGSAVVALNINPERALLGDTNPHLVRFYAAIQAGTVTSATVRAFLEREGAHLLHDGQDHFYRIRDRFNDSGDPHDFQFLNRACFNGLVRFNTPFCRKSDRFRPAYVNKICNQVQRAADRMAGRAWKFVCADWREMLGESRDGDFVYCDPPYAGRFTDYFNSWTDEDSEQLEDGLRALPCPLLYSMWSENKYRRNDGCMKHSRIMRFGHSPTSTTWGDRRTTEWHDGSIGCRMKDFILKALEEVPNEHPLCGVVDRRVRVYPLGPDAKVINTLFEIVARQAVSSCADKVRMQLVNPTEQNYYPDFTLIRDDDDREKIAVDVKTTYRREGQSRFGFTLGSYTSYIRPETEGKNIVFLYGHYGRHWIIGFVYKRSEGKWDTSGRIYSFDTLKDVPIPFDEIEVFMQENWRIAGNKAGSGNAANVGSIEEFSAAKGVSDSETEFLECCRGYEPTNPECQPAYSNINEFRVREHHETGTRYAGRHWRRLGERFFRPFNVEQDGPGITPECDNST